MKRLISVYEAVDEHHEWNYERWGQSFVNAVWSGWLARMKRLMSTKTKDSGSSLVKKS